MTRAARDKFRKLGQATHEQLRPVTLTITIGDQTSVPITAAGEAGDLGWKPSDSGQFARQQTLSVHVQERSLPSWVTLDDLTLHGILSSEAMDYKVTSAQKQGHIWRIVANRWPNPTD